MLPRPPLSVRSWLQNDVCFLRFPPGFPAVPPYLVHTSVAFQQPATMFALTPLLHRTPSCSVPDPSASKSRSGHPLPPFWHLPSGCRPLRFFSSPDRFNRSWNGEQRSPRISRATFCPRRPAQHSVSPEQARSLCSPRRGASAHPAAWPSTARLIYGFVLLRLRPLSQTLPDPASRRRPVILTTPPKSDRRGLDLHQQVARPAGRAGSGLQPRHLSDRSSASPWSIPTYRNVSGLKARTHLNARPQGP
jgi:hypothetical protein